MKKITIKKSCCFGILLNSMLILFLSVNTVNGQDTDSTSKKTRYFVLTGNIDMQGFKYKPPTPHPQQAINPVEHTNATIGHINTRIGAWVSQKFQIGFGFGYAWQKNYLEELELVYDQYSSSDRTGIFEVDKSDFIINLYIRYQGRIASKFNFYFDIETGANLILNYTHNCIACPYTTSPPNYTIAQDGNDFFTNFNGGLIFDISDRLALQSNVISFGYRVDHKKKPYYETKTTNFETIISNPNIGLVFYF